MAYYTSQVVSYKLFQYTKINWDAYIILNLQDGKIGRLYFIKEGGNIMPGFKQGNYFTLYYKYAQYAGIVDMLRNEKPIHFIFREAQSYGYLSTSNEPVGEEELNP